MALAFGVCRPLRKDVSESTLVVVIVILPGDLGHHLLVSGQISVVLSHHVPNVGFEVGFVLCIGGSAVLNLPAILFNLFIDVF